MLRKLIKSLIPSRGDVFFDLFVESAENSHHAAKLLVGIVNEEDSTKMVALRTNLRELRQVAVEADRKINIELNEQFITPIDRGEIFQLSGILLKLTKRIIKINKKMQIYAIDTKMDDCLIRSVETLEKITQALCALLVAFREKNVKKIKLYSQQATQLDENVIEDLGDTLDQIKQADYDMLTTIKLKEIFKSIESAVETSATLCDSVVRIYVKEI